jgi:hypothetical protein
LKAPFNEWILTGAVKRDDRRPSQDECAPARRNPRIPIGPLHLRGKSLRRFESRPLFGQVSLVRSHDVKVLRISNDVVSELLKAAYRILAQIPVRFDESFDADIPPAVSQHRAENSHRLGCSKLDFVPVPDKSWIRR